MGTPRNPQEDPLEDPPDVMVVVVVMVVVAVEYESCSCCLGGGGELQEGTVLQWGGSEADRQKHFSSRLKSRHYMDQLLMPINC